MIKSYGCRDWVSAEKAANEADDIGLRIIAITEHGEWNGGFRVWVRWEREIPTIDKDPIARCLRYCAENINDSE